MDTAKMEAGIRLFLEGIGPAAGPSDVAETPARVARAWADDLIAGYAVDPASELTWTDAPEGCGPVLVRDVRFASVCVHHLLPFAGEAHLAYLPRHRLAGLSKLGRVVDAWSRRLQIQERLTEELASAVLEAVKADGVGVVIEAQHLCMMMRGVEKQNSLMTTSAVLGSFRRSIATRTEFLTLIGRRHP